MAEQTEYSRIPALKCPECNYLLTGCTEVAAPDDMIQCSECGYRNQLKYIRLANLPRRGRKRLIVLAGFLPCLILVIGVARYKLNGALPASAEVNNAWYVGFGACFVYSVIASHLLFQHPLKKVLIFPLILIATFVIATGMAILALLLGLGWLWGW